MQRMIEQITSYYGGGNALSKKVMRVESGTYAGRILVLYSSSPSTIKYAYADPPYQNWSTPAIVASDAADFPCSGLIDSSGHVYVVYTLQSTFDLMFRKLAFGGGAWTVGSAVAILSDEENYFPSIVKDSSGKLTVCWTCQETPGTTQTIRVKQSTNDGLTWGAGPTDFGTILSQLGTSCYGTVVYLRPYIHAFYTCGGNTLAFRRILDGGVLWENEVVLHSGSGLDENLSVGSLAKWGTKIGVVFNSAGRTYYLESDTVNWSGLYDLGVAGAFPPLLLFNSDIPYIFSGDFVGPLQVGMRYSSKKGVGFSESLPWVPNFPRIVMSFCTMRTAPPIIRI